MVKDSIIISSRNDHDADDDTVATIVVLFLEQSVHLLVGVSCFRFSLGSLRPM